MTDIGLMVRSANPVQDESQALTNDELSAVLLLAQQRSGGMDTKQAPPVVAPEKKNRNGWLVAAGAFALVLIVVGASLLLSNNDSEAPPATTPPTTEAVTPTTEAAPPTTVAEVVDAAVSDPTEQIRLDSVDRLLALASGGDFDGLTSALEGATVSVRLERGGVQSVDLAQSESQLALESALGTRFVADSCTMGDSSTRIECVVLATESVRDALGLKGLDMLLKADVDDQGEVTWFLWQWGIEAHQHMTSSLWFEELEPFTTWLAATHPGDIDTMIADGTGAYYKPSIVAESVALWTRRVPEFLETVDTNGATASTTVAAPAVSSEQAAAIASFEAAWNDGDEGALRAQFAPNARIDYSDGQSGLTDVDRIMAWALARNAMEVVVTIDDCVSAADTVRCIAEFDGAVITALNFVPLKDVYTIAFEDGLIAHIGVECQICENTDLEFKMGQWVRTQAPGAQAQCSPGCPTHAFVRTPEQAAYFLEWAPKWQEAGRP